LYTQCPECEIAFRVTAHVLQQAVGRVRCGGCGHAFSALDHLSESMPEPTGDHLEVRPPDDFADGATDDDLPADDKLAETSRRLLETLDELAGPADVRIEDTGVEWRVLDEVVDGVGRPAEPAESGDQESLELETGAERVAMERRYDDNTPLGDDFDDDSDGYTPPAITPKRRAEDQQSQETSEFDEAQRDLALSEPGDWTGLLDEVSEADVIPLEVEEELAAIHSQLSSREAKPEPDMTPVELNQPVDLDKQFEMQAEAMGLDITGSYDIGEEELTDEIPLLDDDFEDSAEEEAGTEDSAEVELVAETSREDDSTEGELLADDSSEEISEDEDSAEVELVAEASDDEESAEDELLADDDLDEEEDSAEIAFAGEEQPDKDIDADEEHEEKPDESTGEFDANIDIAARALADGENEEWNDADADADVHAAAEENDEPDDAANEDDEDVASSGEYEIEDEPETEEDSAEDFELDEEAEADRDSAGEIGLADDYEHELSAEDEALIRDIEGSDEPASDDEPETDIETEHVVPPQTEAEMTVNMEIDAELLAAAAEEEKSVADAFGVDAATKMFDENSAEVETIIMEGEFVRSAIDRERLAAESDARSQIDEYGKLADTYALNRDNLRGGRRRYDPSSYTVLAGALILALVLIGQVIHGTRDSLATYGFFNQTIGPVYRLLGSPVTPEWDIKGWQFESTSGSTDENEEVLTVFSRLVNKSEQPLPFPLVHVSLTDRWEEIIGSRVLEPNEYLAGDLDPSKPVTPGENFTAVITIDSPSDEATGFKLNVCYRVSPGRVRCAIEDFKN